MNTLAGNIERWPASATTTARRLEHRFFTGMAIAIALTVHAGLARTCYLRLHFGTSPLQPLLHSHGFVFTSWIVLYFTQTPIVSSAACRCTGGTRLKPCASWRFVA